MPETKVIRTIQSTLRRRRSSAMAALCLAIALPIAAAAEDFRSPFGDGSDMGFPAKPASKRPASAPLPPMQGLPDAPPSMTSAGLDERTRAPGASGAIEKSDLPPLDGTAAPGIAEAAPIPAAPPAMGTGLPDANAEHLERLLGGLELPPHSPALAALFAKVLSALPAGRPEAAAVRLQALYRAGALDTAALLSKESGEDPVLQALAARIELAFGRRDDACGLAKRASADLVRLPPHLAADVIAIQGYCAAQGGAAASAGLFAALARESGAASPATLAILDAIAIDSAPALDPSTRISIVDLRLVQLAKGVDLAQTLPRAEPAVLAALAFDQRLDPTLRIKAAETAAAKNIIAPDKLAAAWRALPGTPANATEQAASNIDPTMRRAALFRAVESERTPSRKARLIRSLLDEARRNGPYHPTLTLLAGAVESLAPIPEIGWFAETATEILIAAGRYDRARAWESFSASLDAPRSNLAHWLALIDIADPTKTTKRGDDLRSVEELALHGRFSTEALHRLAAVLDALDYNVPVRLWEAASRTPQPSQGFLPETGVLAELQAAARERDALATAALAIRSTGPGRADEVNILALGDVIRALRRTGFEAEARRYALEALLPVWPRSATGG